jgi:hypothetical protein
MKHKTERKRSREEVEWVIKEIGKRPLMACKNM